MKLAFIKNNTVEKASEVENRTYIYALWEEILLNCLNCNQKYLGQNEGNFKTRYKGRINERKNTFAIFIMGFGRESE
jgi:hypothetical protein